jgi:hypothetical protein
MRKYFNIIIELDTDTPEAVATVLNIDQKGALFLEDLPKHSCFDVTPSQFDLHYSFTSSILSGILRDLANNIDDVAQKEYFGISEEDEQ